MSTFAQLRERVYAYLGTTAADQAYTPARVGVWLNDALNALAADLPGEYLVAAATLAPDGGAGRVYTLTSQSPPITSLRSMRAVRLRDAEGQRLREVPYDDLGAWGGPAYALRGPDEAAVLETGRGVESGAALHAVYATWPAELAGDNDTPSAIPAHFHDLLALEAAKLAFASGDESRWPETYEERRRDRTAQFLAHVGRRSGAPATQRAVEVEAR